MITYIHQINIHFLQHLCYLELDLGNHQTICETHVNAMGRIGAALLSKLATFQIYGANTNVGKTVASTVICKGFRDKGLKTLYLKPVSTGSIEHVDSR